MKNLLLAITCFLLTANIFAQQQQIKIDTIVTDRWVNNAWQHSGKFFATYNNNCLLQSYTSQGFDTASQKWVNSTLTSFTYLSGNYISEKLLQEWNDTTMTWINFSRIFYNYNASFKVTTEISQRWSTGGIWTNSDSSTYTYDVNGFLVTKETQNWSGSAWVNTALINYTNNSSGYPTQEIDQYWNSSTSSYDTSSRTAYTYNNANKVATELYQYWQSPQFVNSSLTTNTYDGNNYLTNILLQSWNSTTSSWVNEQQDIYTNNSNGTPAQFIDQLWNTTTNSWDNNIRETAYYTTNCTLPLTLLDLTATKSNNSTVNVNWQTTNEINTSYFAVQRSIDAINFNDIGKVNAGQGAIINNYVYTDNISNIKASVVYYRLQMVDKDGKYTTSKIVSVPLINSVSSLTIHPNPAKNYFIISTPLSAAGTNATITITDFAGRIIVNQHTILNGDQKVNISSLQTGVYMVSIKTSDGHVFIQKLIVE